MRFVVMGIRKDIAGEVKLPEGMFKGGPYRTVHDAIADLEKIEPVFDTKDDIGICLEEIDDLSDLAKDLRNAKILKNHIINVSSMKK